MAIHRKLSNLEQIISGEARYRTRPESHVTDIRLVDTGQFQDVAYQNILGLEVAGALGSFTGRMEAFKSTWDRVGGVKNDFYGAYLELDFS